MNGAPYALRLVSALPRAGAVHVADGCVIPAAETHAVIAAVGWRDELWITELIAIIHVGRATVLKVPARAFYAVAEAALLSGGELGWRRVPAALGVTGRRRRRALLIVLGPGEAGCGDESEGG